MSTQMIYGKDTMLVAIDVYKARHDILLQYPSGKRKKSKIANTAKDYHNFIQDLKSLGAPCIIALEATANYHRTIAYYLQTAGFTVHLVSSLAVARTREALHNSSDKNDSKDTQVILHLLRTGVVQRYYDPLIHQFNDIQEISKTYHQVSLRKVKIQHSIMNHYLPLYFPEIEKYFHTSRAQWVTRILLHFPNPSAILKYRLEEFTQVAWPIVGRKVNKKGWLIDFYHTAQESIGLPVPENSEAIGMFRLTLQEHQHLCSRLKEIEGLAHAYLETNPDYHTLRTIPGIGPILALTILAEAGDIKRFNHFRQFLSFCGLNLCTHQSGYFRGQSRLSKHGNSRLRYAFWIAASVAIRMRENTFRKKFDNYIKKDPLSTDLKRKAYTAVAAKMARVVYSTIKNKQVYRCSFEPVISSGRIASVGP